MARLSSACLAAFCFVVASSSFARCTTIRNMKFDQNLQFINKKMAGGAVVTYNDVSVARCAARCASKFPCSGFTFSAKDRVCMVCGLCGNFTMMDAPGYRLYTPTGASPSSANQVKVCPSNLTHPTACWKQAPGWLTFVSVGPVGVWGINGYDYIYYGAGTYGKLNGFTHTWKGIDGLLVQLDVSSQTFWGVNKHNIYYNRENVALGSPTGNSWKRYDDIRLKWISVSPGGSMWGRNTAGRAVHRQQSAWQDMGMDIQRVDAGVAGVWVLNTTGHLFHRLGTYGDSGSAAGTGWRALQGTFHSVACGRDLVVGVDLAGQVWLRTGLGPDTPTGLAWVPYPGSMKQVDVFQTDQGVSLWGIDSKGKHVFSVWS